MASAAVFKAIAALSWVSGVLGRRAVKRYEGLTAETKLGVTMRQQASFGSC